MSKSTWSTISLIIDATLVNLAIISAFLLRFGGALPAFNFQAYTNLALAITVIQIAAFYIYDLYDVEKVQTTWDVFYAVLKAVTLGFLVVTGVTFFYRFFSFPRMVLLLSWLLNLFLITGWRIFATKALKIKWPSRRVLIVGTDEAGQEILRELQKRSQWGYKVMGLIGRSPEKLGERLLGISVIGLLPDIISFVQKYRINQIIVTIPINHRELIEDLARATKNYVRVDVIPDHYEILTGKADYTLMSDIPLMELTKEPTPSWVHLAKQITDLILALLILVLASPLMLLAAALIKLTSKGPLIYKQERVGQYEKLFKVYKFRTMVAGAEEETGPILALEDDTRVTPVGRFLRKTRIDELPQVINILKGEMSFVGPRPERPVFVEEFKRKIPGYSERFKAKPGVTGLAQVSGFYVTTARNKLKYDLIYIHHQSLFLDFKILLHTLKVVLTGRGAR